MMQFTYYIHEKYLMPCVDVIDCALDGLLSDEEMSEIIKNYYLLCTEERLQNNMEIIKENFEEHLFAIRAALAARKTDKMDRFLKIWKDDARAVKTEILK